VERDIRRPPDRGFGRQGQTVVLREVREDDGEIHAGHGDDVLGVRSGVRDRTESERRVTTMSDLSVKAVSAGRSFLCWLGFHSFGPEYLEYAGGARCYFHACKRCGKSFWSGL
jgi:hypothetical protein